MDQYKFIQKLGEGGQGNVILVQQEDSMFALKRMMCSDLQELNTNLKEAQAVLQLKHPFVVKCYEFFVSRTEQDGAASNSKEVMNERVCILYEYCEKGSLEKVIQSVRNKKTVLAPKVCY